MNGGLIDRIETGVGRSASALFAGAVGYAAYGVGSSYGLDPQLALGAAGAGTLAYVPCSRLLGVGTKRSARFALPDFTPSELAFADAAEELLLTDQLVPDELLLTERVDSADELILTEADRLDSDAPLVLDDILAAIRPESRVVRLFDRKAMPAAVTPGELQSRIANHVADGTLRGPPAEFHPSDASQALSAALAELRRSLR